MLIRIKHHIPRLSWLAFVTSEQSIATYTYQMGCRIMNQAIHHAHHIYILFPDTSRICHHSFGRNGCLDYDTISK